MNDKLFNPASLVSDELKALIEDTAQKFAALPVHANELLIYDLSFTFGDNLIYGMTGSVERTKDNVNE